MVQNDFGKTVYVLGAGCSKNYKQGAGRSQGWEPPLDADFFEIAARVLEFHSELIPKFQELIRTTDLFYHTDTSEINSILGKWTENPLSLESVLTFLSLKARTDDEEGRLESRKAYSELTKLMRFVFNEALRGPPCNLHRRLARLVRANDAVISYNYDILADNALFLENKMNEGHYLVPFQNFFYQGSWSVPRRAGSGVKLIKLHGSLNWLSCNQCSSLLCFLGEKTPENFHEDHSIQVMCPHCNNSSEVKYIIVPPILHKRYSQPTMRHLWKTAEIELGNADRIVVIGYSMPLTDFRSELLFRSALGNKNVVIEIVNTRKQILERFRSVCQPIMSHVKFKYHRSLTEFLSENENRD